MKVHIEGPQLLDAIRALAFLGVWEYRAEAHPTRRKETAAMVHVGVDLHKRSSQLAVLLPDGEVTPQRLENDPTRLEQFFAELPRGARIAIEASGTW
jgi:hypothetical protein